MESGYTDNGQKQKVLPVQFPWILDVGKAKGVHNSVAEQIVKRYDDVEAVFSHLCDRMNAGPHLEPD